MTLSCTIDSAGISAPSYDEILADLIAQYQAIFGSDVYLGADSQDYEFLAIVARAIHEGNQQNIATYNAYAPSFAQGAGLSALVKINGIRRQAASHSTCGVTLTGQTGTVVNNGIVRDEGGNLWDLPASVTIGGGGTVNATATAQEEGALTAAIGTLTGIYTPTRGWQSVTNAAEATPGAPVETDAELRRRQAISVAGPAQTIVEAISAAVGNVAGVDRYFVYENDTDSTDSNGVPAHSIAVVAGGGDAQAIAEAIASRKPPGIQTYGSTSRVVTDDRGVPRTINLEVLDNVPFDVNITIQSFTGYVSTTGDLIKAAIAEFLNTLEIGEDSYTARLYAPANLSGAAAVAATGLTQAQLDELSETYTVTVLEQRRDADPFGTANVAIAFNEAANMADPDADVTLTVL